MRRHGHLGHHRARQVEFHQHAALEEIARVDALLVQFLEHLRVDGQIAVGGVEHVPVAAGHLGHKRQGHVARAAHGRHLGDVAGVVKAVALHIIGAPGQNRRNHALQVLRAHLPVSVHLDHHRRAHRQRGIEPGQHRAAHAQVARIAHQHHARIAHRQRQRGAVVRAGVIHHHHAPDPVRQPADHALDVRRHAVHGDDHAHAVVRGGLEGRLSHGVILTAAGTGTARRDHGNKHGRFCRAAARPAPARSLRNRRSPPPAHRPR